MAGWLSTGNLRGPTGPTGPEGPVGPAAFFIPLVVAPATLSNAPAGGLEVPSQLSRVQVDLRSAVNVVGQALPSVVPTGVVRFEYSVNAGVSWATLVDVAGPWTANVLRTSLPAAVPLAAKVVSVLLRVVVTGNGVADPILQRAALMFQP